MSPLKVKIDPRPLGGCVKVPSSKSLGHRELICAALAQGISRVENVSVSQDIEATCRALKALGASVKSLGEDSEGRTAYRVEGTGTLRVLEQEIDVGESGSTLRFMIPLALQGAPVTFKGRGRLIARPLDAYYRIFDEQGIEYRTDNGRLPLTVHGRLKAGRFALPGDVSSQFVSGLLFALPQLSGDSVIEITSPLESRAYVDLTLLCLKKYGIFVENREYREFIVPGNQAFQSQEKASVEGDYSQAAFWLVAGVLGSSITCRGMNLRSLQGDRRILAVLERMGARLALSETEGWIRAEASRTHGTEIDGAECPDIIPVLAALASVSEGTTRIVNAQRLRIKESDRLAAIASELNRLGACVEELPDGLVIQGRPGLSGGTAQSWNDHRIAMSLAAVSSRCDGSLSIAGAQCVNKSYPGFWKDFRSLGGVAAEMEEDGHE